MMKQDLWTSNITLYITGETVQTLNNITDVKRSQNDYKSGEVHTPSFMTKQT